VEARVRQRKARLVDNLVAVGLWYADFAQVNDEDVAELFGADGATAPLYETRRPAGSAR